MSVDSLIDEIKLEENGKNEIAHYWSDSYRELISKHIRYLKFEIESFKFQNIKIKKTRFLLDFFYEFKNSFFIYKGYLDRLTGFNLSVFWGIYKHVILILYLFKR